GNEVFIDWPTFDWDNCDNADVDFQAQCSSDSEFNEGTATFFQETQWFDSVSNYTFTSLPANISLYFRVHSRDGAGNLSGWSNPRTTIPGAPVMHEEPEYSADGSNTVYWSRPPGSYSNTEFQYKVLCTNSADIASATHTDESGWITDTTWTFSGLDDNQTYFYRVKAKNGLDEYTNWSDPVSSTQDYDIPEQPFIEDLLPAEVNTNWVQFRFINIDCDYEYILEYANNSAFSGSTLVETGCLSSYKFHFPTTMNDETVWFRIRGKNGTKYSEYSNLVSTYYNPDPALMEYIYYVSPTGNDGRAPNVAMSYDTPWKTIQHAVDNAENGGIIKVAGGTYAEDVIINKPVSVQALNNTIMPEVTGPAGPAFTIYSDSVCLSYLKLYTSYFLNRAAVKAQTVQAVQIDHCTIGISTTENAYYGIWFNNVHNSTIESNTIDFNTEGIYLSNSTNNTLFSNNIHYSEETSLSLYLSDINSIINNDVFEQPTALVINNSTYNNFSYNIFMESDLNIYLTGSSGRNQFCQNGITWGTTGISNNCPADHENKFYLNYLNNNTLDIETTHGENCNMQSPVKFAYRHNSIAFKNYIGNSYTDYTWNDIDNNALGDTPYSFDTNGEDKYPVTNGRDFNIRSWFLSSDHSLPGKSDQKGGEIEIQNGETYNWVSSKLFSYTDFPEGSDRWEINWLIKLALKQAITAGGTFQIDVGYSPSSTGAPFYTTGITGTFDKNDASDFDSRIFYLGLEPEAMDLPRGQYLVLKITNQTGETMTVKTGGSWSYLTPPPAGTCAPYILNEYSVTIEEDSQPLCTCAPFCWQNHVWDPDTPFEDLEITFTNGEHVDYILDHEDFVGTGYRFVPEENWSGFDTLWMHVSDGNASNSRTFVVYVSPVDDAPEIDTAFVHYMNEDGQSLIYNSQYEAFFGQFVEDPDNDFDELYFTVETIDLDELGAYNYNSILLRPHTNFNGWTSYRLIVSDGELADTAECKVYVNPVNDFPEVKFNFTLNMEEDETVTWGFDHTGYRWNTTTWTFPYEINDVDTPDSLIVLSNNLADRNDSTFMIVIESSDHIDVGISGNDFTFTNNTKEWSGTDTLTITVHDPAADTTYNIEKAWPVIVHATNDRPQLTGQPVIRFNEDESLWIKVDTLGNYFADNDNSDDELFISIISNNVLVKENGNIYYTEYHYTSFAGDDSLKFFAPQNWFGNDTLTIRVHDGSTPSTIGSWVVTVDPVNDAPIAGTLPNIRFNEDDTLYVNRSFFTDRISDAETPDSLLLITIPNGIKVRCTDRDTAFLFASFENANGSETLNVIVSDGERTDTTTLFCRIDPVNDAPVIDSLPRIIFPEDQFPEYNQSFWYAYVEDVENNDQSLTYQVLQGNNVSIGRDGNDDHDRFVCSWNWFGTDTLKLRVFDGLLADTAIFIVEVTPVNDVPVIEGLPSCSMQEDDTLSLAFSWFYPYISDVETPDSLLILNIQGNSHITVETADTLFRFIPEADWNGNAYLSITASDGDTTSAQEYLHIFVHPVNDSIHIVFPETITVTEDISFDFEVEMDNPDNDDCGWWLENRPSWMQNNTNTIFGQFGEGISEDCTFYIIGWEIGGLTDTLEVYVDVVAVNDPPYIRFPDTIFTQASTALNEQIIANDPEDSTLVFSLGNHPDWLLLNGNFINGTTPADFSDTSFVLIASDGELNDTAIVALIDSILPLPKVIITSDDYINGTEDVDLEYIASAFSPMGIPAAISFRGLPAWLVQDGDTLTGTPPNGVLSDTICVIGTDGFSENDSMDVFISITPINDPPVITSSKIAFAKEDSSFVYKAEGSDEEGDPLNFHFDYDQTWLFTAGDSLYGTPPEGVLEFQFMLTVSDGQLSNAQLVLVNITAVNDPPVLTSSDTIQVYEDIAFEYLATGDDAEDSTITITFDQVPTWMSTSGDTISGTPVEGTADTTFVVHISDGEINPGYTVTVIANAINDAPTLDSLPAIDGTEDTPFDIVFANYETFAHDTDNVFSELNWEVDGSSSVFTVVSNGNTSATLTPPENWSGSSSVEVTVDDGEFYASRIVSVNIDPVNDAPVAETFPELQMNEDQTIYKNMEFFTSRFSDVETPVDSLEFTIPDGLIVKPTKLDTAVR
ncbi:MAG TPA: tandem-95 repeat protein, partial [Prolixibacteraceae bacterium]|nr:tandem-95 repeat protein [Prolixibacteraceae bacterium]